MVNLPIFFLSVEDGIPFCSKEFSFIVTTDGLYNTINCLSRCKEGEEIIIGLYAESYKKACTMPLKQQFSLVGPVCYSAKCINSEQIDDNTFIVYCIPEKKITINKIDFEKNIADLKPLSDFTKAKLDDQDAEALLEFLVFILKELKMHDKKLQSFLSEDSTIMQKIDQIAYYVIVDINKKYIYSQTIDEQERIKELIYFLLNANTDIVSINLNDLALINKYSKRKNSPESNHGPFKESFKRPDKTKFFARYPEVVQEKIKKELKRFKRMPPTSLEAQTILDYLEVIKSIPWEPKKPEKNLDLNVFKEDLRKTHYGMDKVKGKIEEYVALQIFLEKPVGTIMCFCGPPGTGKTSIAKAIAKATGKEIVKIALGGVTDESEFRGHRRTYVASRPGRIINGLIKAKTSDPIILLDEIDKLSSNSYRGDPTSALLEILDPEQNEEFIDRYIEIPVDLSKVTFIATANYREKIPEPLLDRLDIIKFEYYEENERRVILENYMIPTIKNDYSLQGFELAFSEKIINKLIQSQSIREMEKNIKSIFRQIIKRHLTSDNKLKTFNIDEDFYDFNTTKQKILGFK